MDKNFCRFSEGMITLPEDYCERTLNTLVGPHIRLPSITISRDGLGNHNNVKEYINSQLGILQKQMKDWKQGPNECAILGDEIASGILITYDFMRPDKIRLYQKQAIFTLDMENLLIFSMSKVSPLTSEDDRRFSDILKSFRTNA